MAALQRPLVDDFLWPSAARSNFVFTSATRRIAVLHQWRIDKRWHRCVLIRSRHSDRDTRWCCRQSAGGRGYRPTEQIRVWLGAPKAAESQFARRQSMPIRTPPMPPVPFGAYPIRY